MLTATVDMRSHAECAGRDGNATYFNAIHWFGKNKTSLTAKHTVLERTRRNVQADRLPSSLLGLSLTEQRQHQQGPYPNRHQRNRS